jgi:PAS domain S-box-containing protein/diguanylate cyclase (GGDEF)-like protein
MSEQLRLIVVEDDNTDAVLINQHLTRAGLKCVVHRVETESEFVEALERVKPDVILSDYTMPKFDGTRALDIAIVRAPQTPFVFVSGTIGEQRAIDALKHGATDYILKSNLSRLAPAVQRALREVSLQSAQRQSERQLRDTVETSQDWIWELDASGKFQFSSPAVTRMLGYRAEDLIGQDFRSYLTDVEREQSDALLPAQGQSQLTGVAASWRTADGSVRWLERNVVSVLNESQELIGFRGTDRDITARREQEARLRRLTRTYRMLSSASSANLRLRDRGELLEEVCRIAVYQGGYDRVAISTIDADAKTLRLQAWAPHDGKIPPAMERLDVDVEAAGTMTEGPSSLAAAAVCNDLAADQGLIAHRDILLAHDYRALARLPIVVDGTTIGIMTLLSNYAGVFDDAEVKVLQELVANLGFALQFLERDQAVHLLSYFDGLTGLAKRSLFCQRLTQWVGTVSLKSQPGQVVAFDVQKLHAVNDSFGRYVGDRLLEHMAARLKHAYPNADQLGYFGGGTFAIVLPNGWHASDLGGALQKAIGGLFTDPIHIDGQEFRPTIRYGIASYPDDATSAETLVQRAEASLAAARDDNERYTSYGAITRRPTTRAFALESRLAGALERDEYQLQYQPKIDLSTGGIEGFEALLRWLDLEEGLVPPSTFIPLLERSGAIVEVGTWVLQQAARDIESWRIAGLRHLRVAVNVSALQLRRRDFVAQVLNCIGPSDAPVGLDIELTESMLMQDIELSKRKLTELRRAGVGVAIDDFGTGYSSLRLLPGLPVSALKIDRSFVLGAGESKSGMTLISTVICLGRAFGMHTIAEGVETQEQVHMLRELGCDQAQGYFFARPVPAPIVPDITARLLRGPNEAPLSGC